MLMLMLGLFVGLAAFFIITTMNTKKEPAQAGHTQNIVSKRPSPSPLPPKVLSNGHNNKRNGSTPTARKNNQPINSSEPGGHLLDVHKTLATFDFILRSLGRQAAWATPQNRNNYIHDLVVILDHHDLQTASLELLAPDRTVLYRHRIQYLQATGPRGFDAAKGVELPLLPAGRIAEHRVIFSPVSQIATYRHKLNLPWGDAERLQERTGSKFTDMHTRHINRGRMTGQVFVSDEVRRTATVFNVSAAGDYAFARDPAFPADVYLHKVQCNVVIEFRPGMKVSFIPIGTPRGIQGRNIRLA
jgi:hypothetical protein